MKKREGRMIRIRTLFLCGLLVLTAVFAPSCGKTDKAGDISLYYLESDGTGIRKSANGLSDGGEKDRAKLYEKVFSALAKAPEDDRLVTPITDEVTLLSARYDGESGEADIYLSDSYKSLAGYREALIRACLVKSLLSVDGTKSVLFYVGGDPLTDATGRAVGQMTADSFVGDFGRKQAELMIQDLSIYYASGDGEHLVLVPRNVHYNSNTNIEKLVIESLATEPVGSEAKAIFSNPSEILRVSTAEGICYLDLDNAYFTGTADVTEDVAIYSLVDSLCAVDGVNKVQITVYVNGKPDTGEDSHSGLYEPNMDLITD